MSKVIILDFDGVIADSIEECFIISYWAYQGIRDNDINIKMFNADNKEIKNLFKKFRFLVGPPSEYFFLMKSIYDYIEYQDNNFLPEYKKNKLYYHNEAQMFSERFFKIRESIQNKFLDIWLRLNPIYEGISQLIEYILSKHKLFIASTKDEESIKLIFKKNNLFVPFKNIFGRRFNINKEIQIREIIKRTNTKMKNCYFIDDKIEYLMKIKDYGINCFLASWGYNNAKIQKESEKIGIRVLKIDDVTKVFA